MIKAVTPYGTYTVPEKWADRHMPTLSALADFLVAAPNADEWGRTMVELRTLVDATPEQRAELRKTRARADAALYHWQQTGPRYPIKDAHGPTMRQLVEAIAAANPADVDEAGQ